MDYEIFRITDGYGKVKMIGKRIGDTYYTSRNREFFYRKGNGWAIDIDVINRADIQNYVIHDVEGLENEGPAEYYATREDFLTYGKRFNHAGHGEQMSLDVRHWRKYVLSSGAMA
jgi:hypothetical protein